MRISSCYPGNYLKKEDVPGPVVYTVRTVGMEDVGDGEKKPVMHFNEVQQKLVINHINSSILTEIMQTEETTQWVGRPIELYVDPSIMFGAKRVGGLRVRAPTGQAAGPSYAPPPQQPMQPPPAAQQPWPTPQPGQPGYPQQPMQAQPSPAGYGAPQQPAQQPGMPPAGNPWDA